MDQATELFQAFRIVPHDAAQLAAADAALGIHDSGPELPHDGSVGFPARQHHLVAQLVGFNEVAAEIRQRVANETFAEGQPAGQAYPEH